VSAPVAYTKPDGVSDRDWAIYLARHRDGASGTELAETYHLRQARVYMICRRVVFKVAEGFLATHPPGVALA
jgi:Mor family transcriptional regulator